MGTSKWFVLLGALVLVGPSFAATKDGERPDREMLRMMEFLREMEMIKQMEMMQDMQNVEPVVEPAPGTTAKIPGPEKKKEAAK